MRMERK